MCIRDRDKLRSCHFGYFMQYGLCAKERKAAGFDAPEIGTFLHYLLENVNREVKARGGYGAVERAALRGLVRQYLEKYSEEQLGGCRAKSRREVGPGGYRSRESRDRSRPRRVETGPQVYEFR